MANGDDKIHLASDPILAILGPGIELHGLEQLKVYVVRDDQLEALNASSDQEGVYFGIFLSLAGAAVTAVLGLLLSFPSQPVKAAFYVGTTVALVIGSAVMSVVWHFARRSRNDLRMKVRERTPTAHFPWPSAPSPPLARFRGPAA